MQFLICVFATNFSTDKVKHVAWPILAHNYLTNQLGTRSCAGDTWTIPSYRFIKKEVIGHHGELLVTHIRTLVSENKLLTVGCIYNKTKIWRNYSLAEWETRYNENIYISLI